MFREASIENRIWQQSAMNQLKRRSIALLLCACILLSLVLNIAFVGAHSAHHCHDEQCSVCETLHASYERIKQIGSSLILETITIYLAFAGIVVHLFSKESNEDDKTLVRLKVRMDN